MATSESVDDLLVDQLMEEFAARYRSGERPRLDEYLARYPQVADDLRDLLPAMVEIEQVKADVQAPAEAPVVFPTPTLTHLGDYHILREVGHGGMGVVYEAEQVSLGRRVALKLLTQKLLADGRQKRRFEREAKAAARLHHTNIVPVFAVGEHEGLPYYVMQFIRGLGLDEVLDELRRIRSDPSAPALPTGVQRDSRREEPMAAETDGSLAASQVSDRPPSYPADRSAADMARSLLTGKFELAGDEQPFLVVDDTLAHSPAAESDRLPVAVFPAAPVPQSREDTVNSQLSDTLSLSSSSISLPGQTSDPAHPVAHRHTYWQSVAQIGVQVASALEYAHAQGIVHRDIKPSNLLLDTRGTIWVTDFGLAKTDDHQNLTHTGDILGTVRYMPPEAFAGKSDGRGDIYALGLTLYELLAMRPAFDERERLRLIQQVTSAEFTRLEKLNREIPRDLATIVHKAIERNPAHRYQTAAQLAADLQRYIEDEPIHARPLSQPERVARWCRRNPIVAVLSCALMFVLVGVTVASLLAAAHFDQLARQESQAARNERNARLAEQAAKLREMDARREAEANLKEATAQRERAEANFAKARAAVDDYLTKISESHLLQVPGMQPLRRELLKSALTFYQDFLNERQNDPTIRAGLASAHLRMGGILGELGQEAEANQALGEAQALYEALTTENPGDIELQHGLAQCAFGLDQYDRSISIWRKLVQPDETRFQRELASAYNNKALQRWKDGERGESLELHQQALAIRELLVRLNPDDPSAHSDLAITFNNLGTNLQRIKSPKDSLSLYRSAVEHSELAFTKAPQVLRFGNGLVTNCSNLGKTHRRLGNAAEALAAYQRMVEVSRRMARENPAVPSLHTRLMSGLWELASMQRALKKTDDANRTAQMARDMVDNFPATSAGDLFVVACLRAHGSTLSSREQQLTDDERAATEKDAELAVQALHKAVAAGFRDIDRLNMTAELDSLREREDFQSLQANLEATLTAESLAKDAAADPGAKLKANEVAAALREKLAAADPENDRLQADLAATRHVIGLIQLDLGKSVDAIASFEQAVAIRQKLVDEDPTSATYQAGLAASLFAIGDVYWKSGDLSQGRQRREQAIKLLQQAVQESPDEKQLAEQLMIAEFSTAQDFARCGLWQEAAPLFAQSFAREQQNPITSRWFAAALSRLLIDDQDGYRHLTEVMAERMMPDGSAVEIIRSASLSPTSAIDSARLAQLAEGRYAWRNYDKFWIDYNLGITHYRDGSFDKALDALAGLEHNPAIPEAMVLQAMVSHRLGRTDESIRMLRLADTWYDELLQKALGSESLTLPTTWWTTVAMFEVLRDEASELIDGKARTEHPLMRLHRGRVYMALRDQQKAAVEFAAAIETRPDDPEIRTARARIYSQHGDLHRALSDLNKAFERKPTDSQIIVERNRIESELGRRDRSAAEFLQELGESSQTARAGLLFNHESFVSAPHVSFDSLNAFTIEAWVWNWKGMLFSQGNTGDPENSIYLAIDHPESIGWESTVEGKGGINFTKSRSQVNKRVVESVAPGWTHVAMVYDGERQMIFVGGKVAWNEAVPKPGPLQKERVVNLGAFRDQAGAIHVESRGLLNSLRISKVARYDMEFTPPDALADDDETVMLFDAAQSSTAVLLDLSGNSYHGSIHGPVQYIPASRGS